MRNVARESDTAVFMKPLCSERRAPSEAALVTGGAGATGPARRRAKCASLHEGFLPRWTQNPLPGPKSFLHEPHVWPSSPRGDGGGDGGAPAGAVVAETGYGRDARRRAKHGQSCSTSRAVQPATSNTRHADMERKLGIVAKARTAAARQVRAAVSARATCLRQRSWDSIGRPRTPTVSSSGIAQ